jgi:exodeoxyribonuclease VII large subunit
MEIIPGISHNQPVYTVSEVAQSIKRMVEDRFGRLSVRGEISGWKVASSGHVYFRLKDGDAVIDAVCWKGTAGRLSCKPEDGLEVVAKGKLTTYPGKSSYQIVVDSMEPAGVGALMALLEKRRKALEEEGLFAAARKKKLPFLPQVIGVITSPTGAVIRDILHRISDRFSVHVYLFPVAVQGEGAAEQVANAINFFNSLNPEIGILKPDLLIVARGGGSIEDLWAFNEEIVVRAAAGSLIPLISAVGHETDTTLIDYASDMRAPTPTAAAEMAVPVLNELRLTVSGLGVRKEAAVTRLLAQRGEQLAGLARGLPKPMQLLQVASQRLDDWSERLLVALPYVLSRKEQQLLMLAAALRPKTLQDEINKSGEHLGHWEERLLAALPAVLGRKEQQLSVASSGLRPKAIHSEINKTGERLSELQARLAGAMLRRIDASSEKLANLESLLESVNYKKILARGFALVKNPRGELVTTATEAKTNESLTVIFADGEIPISLKPKA